VSPQGRLRRAGSRVASGDRSLRLASSLPARRDPGHPRRPACHGGRDVGRRVGRGRPPMNAQLTIVLVLLAAPIPMFPMSRPRMDAVALIMLTALPFTGVITVGEALAGFSDSTIVLLGALFVIGEGLVRTGVAQRLGDWLSEKAGSSERRLLVLLMAAVAGL